MQVTREVKLPFAGLRLKLPAGFVLRSPESEWIAMDAGKLQGDRATMAVTIWVEPVEAQTTLAEFVSQAAGAVPASRPATAPSGKTDTRPAVEADTRPAAGDAGSMRGYALLEEKDTHIAGRDARLHIESYNFRGFQTTAARVFFLRPTTGKNQLGYVLVLEAEKDPAHAQLQPLLEAVAGSMELIPVVSPAEEKIQDLAEAVTFREQGYSLRPPANWKVRVSGGGALMSMFQTDYARGVVMPTAQLLVSEPMEGAQACSACAMKKVLERIILSQHKYATVREAGTTVAGQSGHEFIIREQVPPNARGQGGGIVLIAQKTVCANNRSYWLRVITDKDDVAIARASLDRLAEGLELLQPTTTSAPTSSPTSTSTSTSAPASGPTSGPTSVPATTPVSGPISAPATSAPATMPAPR
jgi:hypothetical protein